ncbi:hypothetical protein LTR91_007893 [Friedmanniomyces endolithicus]|uniref:Uncharacterized protein n=1 Tax=Friedmanniomyces endolithicus TaxID=329885 RepID=A0AAN6QVI0_9PEZI|nr:hypothetical protein LTS01_013177 [Friedmanniomyces endolithicus]KAK0993855.1 hypothetical protein LTR91_007893 [Friedmanniomyces endolithicus]KAK1034770.1 hypothetical protein LTS16_015106 [Friedmanniomyces endolithicus]
MAASLPKTVSKRAAASYLLILHHSVHERLAPFQSVPIAALKMSSGSDSLDDSDSDLSTGPDNELILQYLNDFEPHRYPTGAALVPDRTDRIWHNTYTERTRHSFSSTVPEGPLYGADGLRHSSLTTTASRDSTRWQEPRPRHVPGQQRYYRPASRLVGPEPRRYSPLLPALPERELRPPHKHWHEGSSPSPRVGLRREVLAPSPLSREAGGGRETAVVLSGGVRPAYGSMDVLPDSGRTEHADATFSSDWPLVRYQQPRDSGIEVEEQSSTGETKIENTPAQWFSSSIYKVPERAEAPDLKKRLWSWEALPGVEQDVQGSPEDLGGEDSSSSANAPERAETPQLKRTPWSWEALPGIEPEGERGPQQQSGAPLLAIEGPGAEKAESGALVIFSGSSSLRRQPAQKRSMVMRSLGSKFGIGRARGD